MVWNKKSCSNFPVASDLHSDAFFLGIYNHITETAPPWNSFLNQKVIDLWLQFLESKEVQL